MVNYSNAVIYTIRTGDSVYVGSTCNFKHRKWEHKYSLTTETAKQYNLKLYETIRENGGKWDMKPYKMFPCNNKMEMRIEEENCRIKLNADLNMLSCYGFDSKIYHQQWRDQNKESIKNSQQKYNENNKDKLIQNRKVIVTCECGCKTTKQNMTRHKKSNKHLKLLEANQQNIKED